ncbi:MAG: hypothetical protein ACO4AJ_08385 [Prochlorothrix sp.]
MKSPIFSSARVTAPRFNTTILRILGVMAGLLGTTLTAHALTSSDLPTTIEGESGGPESTQSCGSIASTPHAELELSSATCLKLSVTGGNDPTLYIQGPLNLCVLSDKTSDDGLQTSGRWPAGTYQIFVGEKDVVGQDMTLSIQNSD